MLGPHIHGILIIPFYLIDTIFYFRLSDQLDCERKNAIYLNNTWLLPNCESIFTYNLKVIYALSESVKIRHVKRELLTMHVDEPASTPIHHF